MADWLVEQLDDNFLAHLEALRVAADLNADAACAGGQPAWYSPPLNGWSGNPLDVQGMNAAFDRSTINSLYVSVMTSTEIAGRQGEAMLLKLQLDYLAALERAYRTRHASSVRCRIHASSRRNGHSASGGLFHTGNGSIVTWLNRKLAAAHDDPEA